MVSLKEFGKILVLEKGAVLNGMRNLLTQKPSVTK
jgi:hypothetical protein